MAAPQWLHCKHLPGTDMHLWKLQSAAHKSARPNPVQDGLPFTMASKSVLFTHHSCWACKSPCNLDQEQGTWLLSAARIPRCQGVIPLFELAQSWRPPQWLAPNHRMSLTM